MPQKTTQVKVTAIDVGGKARRASQIETEMNTQWIGPRKESVTYLNNISELNRKNNISIHDNPSHIGSLLRQSQSGMNLPPEKKLVTVGEDDDPLA